MILRWLEDLIVRYGDTFSSDSRALTDGERGHAREVFADALDLEPVRIARSSIPGPPMVLGNLILIPPGFEIDGITLIHELAHAWQYQTRSTEYISNSVWHQAIAAISTGSRAAAYEVSWADLATPSILDLPAEKQAVIIERWFAFGHLRKHPDFQRHIAEVRARCYMPSTGRGIL